MFVESEIPLITICFRQLVSDSEDDDDAGDDVKDGHDGGVDFADNAFLSDSNLNTTIPNKSILPDFGKGKCHFEKPFRIWHSLKITSLPSRPLNTLEVKCTCHSRTTIELLVENPESSKIECDVLIEGEDLIPGEETLSVQSKAAGIYHVDFAPTVIKRSRGRYDLMLDYDSCVNSCILFIKLIWLYFDVKL